MRIVYERKQVVSAKLLRKPTNEEIQLLLKAETMFDVEDLVDWDNEEILEEDYSTGFMMSNERPYIKDERGKKWR